MKSISHFRSSINGNYLLAVVSSKSANLNEAGSGQCMFVMENGRAM